MNFSFKSFTVCVLFLVLILFACEKKVEPAPIEPDPVKIDTTANVMFINASPNSVGFDVLVDNVVLTSSKLTYPNNSVYFKILASQPTFKFNVSQTTVTYLSETKTLDNNFHYSFFLIDSIIKKAHLFITDDVSNPIDGKAKIRCIHLAPGSPNIDIAAIGANIIFSNRSYRSFTSFVNVSPGDYNLEVRVAGTANVKYTIPKFTLEEGKLYTLLIKGFDTVFGTQGFGAQVYRNK